MLGLPRGKSAFVWFLLLSTLVSVPYSVYHALNSSAERYHGSADDLAESLLSEGATLTVVPADTRSKTVDSVEKLNLAPVKIVGMRLEQTDDIALLDALEQLPELRSLELRRMSVAGMSLPSLITRLPLELTALRLVDPKDVGDVSGVTREIAKRFLKLRTLELQGMSVTDDDVVALASLPTLQDINLSKTDITDLALWHVRALPLTTLRISKTAVTSAGLRAIPRTVKTLSLEYLPLTDEDIMFLAKEFPSLIALSLRGTAVTDAAVVPLAGMTTLQRVQLQETQVSPQGIEALRRALPNATIQD